MYPKWPYIRWPYNRNRGSKLTICPESDSPNTIPIHLCHWWTSFIEALLVFNALGTREGASWTPKRQRPRCSFVWFIMETDTSDKESSLHFQYKTLIQNKTSQKLRQVTLDRFFKWSRSNIKCTNVGMWSLRGDLARCKIRMPLCQSVSRGPCSKARD